MASVECNKSLLRGLAENLHTHGKSQSITLQHRHEEATEVDLAVTSFKPAIAPAPGDLRISFGELSAVVAEEEEERPI
jgi:hypothetical protein